MMPGALLPSRLIPQATRSSSSGTSRPWKARTIAREAAPHSVASICRTVGVLTRRTVLRGTRDATALLTGIEQLLSGRLRAQDDRGRRQRAVVHEERRPLARCPLQPTAGL